MRTLLRRLVLWALDTTPEQLELLRGVAIQGDTITAGTIEAAQLTPSQRSITSEMISYGAITTDHLSTDVLRRLLVHPTIDNGAGRVPHPSAEAEPWGGPQKSSGRQAPQPPVARTSTGERKQPEGYVPDLAARDGNGGA